MKRNLSIDLVKIIAMFMVMAIHIKFTGIVSPSWLLKCNYGYACIAVPLFFMVSGFLLSGKQLTVKYSIRKIKGILKFVFITITFIIVYWAIHDYIRLGYNTDPYFHIDSYISWFWQRGLMWQYWYFGAMIIIYATTPIISNLIHSKKLIVALAFCIIISFIFFILDSIWNVENYIRQTFRIWYWYMYFLLGAYIRLNRIYFNFINWKHAIIMCILYTIFQTSGISHATCNEYYFGSVLCMLYAISVFCACINTKIKKSKAISTLSSFFLPIYAIHLTTMQWISHLSIFLTFNPIAQYIIAYVMTCTINVLIAYVLMKTPYIKNIFKI